MSYHASVRTIAEDFSKAAETYDTYAHLQRHVLEQSWILLSHDIAPNAIILDAGCGTGNLRAYVSNGVHLIGCDIAPGMCCAAHRKGYNEIIEASVENIPLPNKSVGAIMSSLVMQWVADAQAALNEAYRLLTPGGKMLCATLGTETLKELRAVAGTVQHPLVHDFTSRVVIKEKAVHAGFNVVLCEEAEEMVYYKEVRTLLKTLKGIGATYKSSGAVSQPGLMTPAMLKHIEAQYGWRFGDNHGIPATWQIIYMLLEKPGN